MVVDAVVVPVAEADRVGQVGGTAVGPGFEVMGFGPSGGISQPSARQRRSRSRMALRWAGENRRRDRLRSRTSLLPPTTAGMILAVHANRRTSLAD